MYSRPLIRRGPAPPTERTRSPLFAQNLLDGFAGTALLRRLEEALAARGCLKVNLQVRASNAGVVAFYERLGYAVEQRVSMGKRLY